ncbi:MAG: tetratricopeptide repeat protein [Thermoflexibacter sp.]|nr:tetratricopeptide repeat protein [Thermoflexibacter sp.]
MKKTFTFFFIFSYLCAFAQEEQRADSLFSLLNQAQADNARTDVLIKLASFFYELEQPQKVIDYAQQAYILAEKNSDQKNMAEALSRQSSAYFLYGNEIKNLEYASKALLLYEELKDKKNIAYHLGYVGYAHRKLGNYVSALDYSLRCLRAFEELRDEAGIAKVTSAIGVIYFEQGNFEQAYEFKTKSLEIFEKLNNKDGQIENLRDLGNIFTQVEEYEQAMNYLSRAVKLSEESGNKRDFALVLNDLGKVYAKQSMFGEALNFYNKALEIFKLIDNKGDNIATLCNIGEIYTEQTEHLKAISYYQQAIQQAEAYKRLPDLKNAYQGMANTYAKIQNFEQAFDYQQKFMALKDSLFNQESHYKMISLQNASENEKREAVMQMQFAKERQNRFVLVGLLSILFLISIFTIVFYYSNFKNKEINVVLQKQNQEITKQKEEIQEQSDELKNANEKILEKNIIIEKKNDDITASINYAKRIQTSMLPSTETMTSVLPESFVFFKPKEIISGDFYWFAELSPTFTLKSGSDKKIILVAADCTGHGVPGALMSMLGDSLLNQIVFDKEIYSPDLILKELHKGVQKVLHQGATENKDGMDVSVCMIDMENRTLEFAGASNPLIYIQPDIADMPQIHQLKGDRMHIGGKVQSNKIVQFNKHVIKIDKPTTFYIFSDGFQDQFGQDEASNTPKKFLPKRFRDLLFCIHHLDMQQQKEILELTLQDWKGKKQKQTDDILIIGVRV